MKKQNLLLGVFATLLLLSAPAAYAAVDEAAENAGAAAQGQEERGERGPPPPRGEHRGPPPRPRGPKLTETQRACMDGLLGKPGSGERPSREKMDAAMETCGVPKPPHGGRPPRSEEAPAEQTEE